MFNEIGLKVKSFNDNVRYKMPAKLISAISSCNLDEDAKKSIAGKATLAAMIVSPVHIFADASPDSIISSALGVVSDVFKYLGIFFLAVSFMNLISALKQEDGDRQQKAIAGIVISVIMIANKPLLNGILSAATGGTVKIA